jgi:Uri superfamily endonuclease
MTPFHPVTERKPGSYLLLLHAATTGPEIVLRIGRFSLLPGWYLYTGSALGPGGVGGRLAHHLRPVRRPHWHIDHLRLHLPVVGGWVAYGSESAEHRWATALHHHPAFNIPLPRFGASDCRCPAHLFYTDQHPKSAELATILSTPTLQPL